MTTATARRRAAAALSGAALAVAALGACGGGGSYGNQPASSPAPTTTPSVTQSEGRCAGLVDSGQALVSTATRFVSGNASADDVRSAANDVSTQVDKLRATAGPEAQANLDQAKTATQRMGDALTAQPPDMAAVRAASTDALRALRDAADVCTSGTMAPTS
ncbi:hypothetical protein [Prauserella cavernicola]|uniref:Uncharacterized protein n=1 Tax=Prauserella cavernicola TaxID=2800127 RepID=A0A934QUU4_9PSEU|nr:hypothetical protein [Prauserella cavernicola]MBK1786981.1 hypothetical protein [Prauserella cavernicola]